MLAQIENVCTCTHSLETLTTSIGLFAQNHLHTSTHITRCIVDYPFGGTGPQPNILTNKQWDVMSFTETHWYRGVPGQPIPGYTHYQTHHFPPIKKASGYALFIKYNIHSFHYKPPRPNMMMQMMTTLTQKYCG